MKESLLFFFIILCSIGLKSQYPKGQSLEQRATGKVGILKSMLNLTNLQTEKVMQIYLDHYKSTDSLKKIIVKRGPNPQTINLNLSTMLNAKQLETDKKIGLVLNNEQKPAYAKFVISRKMGIETIETAAPFR